MRKDKYGNERRRPNKNEHTKKQWNDLGYKVNHGSVGFWFYYWEYFSKEQTTQMTDEEFQAYKQEKRRIAKERKAEREQHEKARMEYLERERERKKKAHEEAVEKKRQQMKKDKTKLIKVYVDGEGYYIYEAPREVKCFDRVVVPYADRLSQGEVTEAYVPIDDVYDEYWFPKKLKKIIIHRRPNE